MSAIGLLKMIPNPTDNDIDAGMSGNICRCGTYSRIREAIHLAAQMLRDSDESVVRRTGLKSHDV
jgi:isoquinoline 1-oxidoreductase alpha subunit